MPQKKFSMSPINKKTQKPKQNNGKNKNKRHHRYQLEHLEKCVTNNVRSISEIREQYTKDWIKNTSFVDAIEEELENRMKRYIGNIGTIFIKSNVSNQETSAVLEVKAQKDNAKNCNYKFEDVPETQQTNDNKILPSASRNKKVTFANNVRKSKKKNLLH